MGARFGKRLVELRKSKNLSQKVLSELCGLSKNMVARYESGEREPSVGKLELLADTLHVSVDDLLGRTAS